MITRLSVVNCDKCGMAAGAADDAGEARAEAAISGFVWLSWAGLNDEGRKLLRGRNKVDLCASCRKRYENEDPPVSRKAYYANTPASLRDMRAHNTRSWRSHGDHECG